MVDVVVVKGKSTKNVYFLSPNLLKLSKGSIVVIKTENGLQLGEVSKGNYKEKETNLVLPLNKVIRIATKGDLLKDKENCSGTVKALNDARKISKELGLNMNFVECYYNLDKSQLIFSFLSDSRVDFRELAKRLAQKYKTRIELRQIGVRDKAK